MKLSKVISFCKRRPKLAARAPIAFVLILAWLFKALGGGQGLPNDLKAAGLVKGVNMALPAVSPEPKGKTPDKLDMYAKAALDSAKFTEQLKQDPYAAARVAGAAISGLDSLRVLARTGDKRLQTDLTSRQLQMETTADQLMQRINQLKTLTQQSPAPPNNQFPATPTMQPLRWQTPTATQQHPTWSMPQQSQAPRQDVELTHFEAMLDKLYRVQHPGLINKTVDTERIDLAVLQSPGKEQAVHVLGGDDIGPLHQTAKSGFIEIGETEAPDSDSFAEDAIAAVIANDQTLTAGTTVKLRLSQEAAIKGIQIPSGQELNGMATLSGERLNIAITSIRIAHTLIGVSLQVYDLDGLPGIRVPGALSRDVSKQSADEALGGLAVASVDPSLSAQAATAGLQFAKSLASRKVRLVRVTLPAGYRVLLKNYKSNNH